MKILTLNIFKLYRETILLKNYTFIVIIHFMMKAYLYLLQFLGIVDFSL